MAGNQISSTGSKLVGFLETALESKVGRHTFGRIDAIARTAALAFGSILQIAKLSSQTVLCAASFGKLCAPKTISKTSSWFVITLYKTAIAFRDVLVAPPKKSTPSIEALKTVCNITFTAKDLGISPVKETISRQPFFKIFD